MNLLSEKILSAALSPEDKANACLSLFKIIDNGEPIPTSVNSYLINEKSELSFLSADSDDCSFACIEEFTGAEASTKEKMLFTAGLLMFYIYNGKSYYDVKGISPFDALALSAGSSSGLIDSDELAGSLRALTSWNPEKRYDGIECFFNYVTGELKNTYSVKYINAQGDVIKEIEGELKGEIARFPDSDEITDSSRRKYRVKENIKIPFRAGKSCYRIQVEPLKQEAENEASSQEGTDEIQTEALKKVEGIFIGNRLPDSVRSLAKIEAVCDGEVVFTKTVKNLKKEFKNYPYGQWLKGDDGAYYCALETADIKALEGAYLYRIKVKKLKGKVKPCIMLESGPNSFVPLIYVGDCSTKRFSCTASERGLNVTLVGGFVAEEEGIVLFRGPVKLSIPSVRGEQKVTVTLESGSDDSYFFVSAYIAQTGEPLLESAKIRIYKPSF